MPNSEETQADTKNTDSVLGWKRLLLNIFYAAILYCFAFHLLSPVKPDSNLVTHTGRFVYVIGTYLSIFMPVYVVVSIITMVLIKILNKNKVHITNILGKAIVPSLIVGGILIFGSWYGTAHADEMTPALRKDVYNKIVQDCYNTQKGAAVNRDIPIPKIEEYCKCGASSISKKVVASDIRFATSKGSWPDSFNTMMVAESQKCFDKVMSKGKR